VSANGGANGIALIDTDGSFTVNGTGAAGTGGTIQNSNGGDGATAGSGVYLSNATNVSLAWMSLHDFQNFAIRGINVSTFSLTNSVINGVNGSNPAVDEASVAFDGLTGTATISSCDISGGIEDNFRVRNTAGTLDRITFTSVTIGPNDSADGNDGLNLEAFDTAVINATIQNGFFTSAAGDLFQLNNIGSAACDLVFTGNTLSNNHANIATGGGGVTIGGGDLNGSLTYNIANNTFRDAVGHAVLIVKSIGTGTYSGTFTGNTIGVQGVSNSGSLEGSGLVLQNAGGGVFTATVTNNSIYRWTNFGINLQAGAGVVASGQLNATITGNTVASPNATTFITNGLHVNSGVTPGDTFAVCATIGGAGVLRNTLTGTGTNGGTDFRLRQRQSTTVKLPSYAGANNDNNAVVTYVTGNNIAGSGLASNTVPTGGGFVGGVGCP
ncbi:MAG: hypothetical protein HY825_00315, partial [Acidobacteria bacterium]|nr:hypothetical protein [Acidobacteriota bacterium]